MSRTQYSRQETQHNTTQHPDFLPGHPVLCKDIRPSEGRPHVVIDLPVLPCSFPLVSSPRQLSSSPPTRLPAIFFYITRTSFSDRSFDIVLSPFFGRGGLLYRTLLYCTVPAGADAAIEAGERYPPCQGGGDAQGRRRVVSHAAPGRVRLRGACRWVKG